ncbi:MAG: hypothetical protein BWY68_00125 [bacterium ADurb.Bin400]|nr:MAG: hypothetical protein BWY68_00125 [bacterium ADurb.Bin400]
MIDDSLEHAIDCSQAGIDVVLFDQPWNRFGAPEGISRVQSWDEIGKVVSSKN